MGYMRHDAIVVTSYDRERAERAHAFAFDTFLPIAKLLEANGCSLVSEILSAPINSAYTFVIGPDGSKEGWEPSDMGDSARNTFVEWLDAQRHEDGSSPYDWVWVQYGDDYLETRVVSHSDEGKRRRARSGKKP